MNIILQVKVESGAAEVKSGVEGARERQEDGISRRAASDAIEAEQSSSFQVHAFIFVYLVLYDSG